MGALLSRGLVRRIFLLLFEFVETSDNKKNGKSDDSKANDRAYEHTIVESRCRGLLGLTAERLGDIFLRDAQEVEDVRQAGLAQGGTGHPVKGLLGIVRDAQTGLPQHERIVGPVAHHHDLVQENTQVA